MIKDKESALFAEWTERVDNFAKDGVVSEKLYEASAKRLLFVLKETNDTKDFDLRRFLSKGARPQTWDNVTRWVMGIRDLGTDIDWQAIKKITLAQRRKHLSSIAAINMKKKPGRHTTDVSAFWSTIKRDADFIGRQIGFYDADLIILCGSIVATGFKHVFADRLTEPWRETSRGISYVEYTPGKFAINYAHPEARVHDTLLYYGLIDAVREIERTSARRRNASDSKRKKHP